MSRRTIRNKGVIVAANLQRPPAPGERLVFRVDPWTRKLIRPLMISLLAVSFAVALLVIARTLSPETVWMALIPLCFLVALEGTYTSAWLNNPDSNGVDRLSYRAAEVLLILVIARVYSWIIFVGGLPSPGEMRVFLVSPVAVLSIGSFLSTAFVTLVAWWLAVTWSRIFTRLDVSIYEINFYTMSAAEQKAYADNRPIQTPREELQNQYLNTWLLFGMGMVFLAALSTFEVKELTNVTNPFEIARLGLTPAMLFALMIYFLVGFWLLSHARLLRMNARWLMDGVAREVDLERAWQRSTMIVLGLVALIAAFLPIGSTLAISQILSLGLAGVGYLVSLFLSLFGYLTAAALMLLTQNVEEAEQVVMQPTPAPLPTPPPALPAPPNEFLTMAGSSALWALGVAIVIVSLLFLLRERGHRLDKTVAGEYWSTLVAWVREIWLRLRGRVQTLSHGLQARLQNQASPPIPQIDLKIRPPRFLRLGELSPREQIRFYYLALLRRAAESGVDRRDSETPSEFAQDLKETWPDSGTDIDALTEAFLEARYSPQPIDKHQAIPVRERWKSLRSRLRKLR